MRAPGFPSVRGLLLACATFLDASAGVAQATHAPALLVNRGQRNADASALCTACRANSTGASILGSSNSTGCGPSRFSYTM